MLQFYKAGYSKKNLMLLKRLLYTAWNSIYADKIDEHDECFITKCSTCENKQVCKDLAKICDYLEELIAEK